MVEQNHRPFHQSNLGGRNSSTHTQSHHLQLNVLTKENKICNCSIERRCYWLSLTEPVVDEGNKAYGELMEWKRQAKTVKKHFPVPLCLSQRPQRLVWGWIRTSMAEGRRFRPRIVPQSGGKNEKNSATILTQGSSEQSKARNDTNWCHADLYTFFKNYRKKRGCEGDVCLSVRNHVSAPTLLDGHFMIPCWRRSLKSVAKLWFIAIWYDVIYDMIWYDTIWYDMIWYDMIWYDMIWYDMIWYDMIWYDMICFDIWYDMIYDIWYDMIWYDMIWYVLIWYDIFVNFNWVNTRWQ